MDVETFLIVKVYTFQLPQKHIR